MLLCAKLKKFREICGFTQQQVADVLQIDRSTYSYYETGKTTPDLKTIKKLIKIFNISYMDILEDDEKNINVSDVSDENYYYNNTENKDSNNINKLTKNEKSLIMAYRLLPNEEKQDILKNINSKIKITNYM